MLYQIIILAFIISYLGSIPPGTINVTTMQLTVLGHKRGAFFFALAASLVEFVYAGITVQFQLFLSESPLITENFQIITAIAMLVLGAANLISRDDSKRFISNHKLKGRNGFKRGLVLGLLNPLTIPFWLAVTAYLQNHKLIVLEDEFYWAYLVGISLGTLALLLTIRSVGKRFQRVADNQFLVHKLPGTIFILLGLYNLTEWLFS